MTEIIFDENEDWEERILCSDESCIGTIGPDGKCRECGKPYDGKLPEGKVLESVHERVPEEKVSIDTQPDDDWETRVLCPDGSCIGVIGPDGKCKECGKSL
ncbi:MAG: hypothetical protein CVU55_07150 [Deltaproteobacteria bacterium HGW-Deltaproteobacteria-13]|jgi:hypothetical protein|nr:MAG: hypothetical protein CVU55_07150 [Deltaproteobacteria bacterium HGW-Deltaproteobacteria-13]